MASNQVTTVLRTAFRPQLVCNKHNRVRTIAGPFESSIKAFSTTRVVAQHRMYASELKRKSINPRTVPVVVNPRLKDYWDKAMYMLVEYPAAKELLPHRLEEPEYDYVYTQAFRARRVKELIQAKLITADENVIKLMLEYIQDLKNDNMRLKRLKRYLRSSRAIIRLRHKKQRSAAYMKSNVPKVLSLLCCYAVMEWIDHSNFKRKMSLEEELNVFNASKAQSDEAIPPVDNDRWPIDEDMSTVDEDL